MMRALVGEERMNTIRELWDGAASKYAGLPAVAWLDKKDIKKKSYGELDAAIKAIRKGLKAAHRPDRYGVRELD